MKVILISGKSGSGKDQLSDYIKAKLEQRNNRVLTIHFGDPVKFFLQKYYNWNGIKDEHGRYLLQHLGTDTVRKHFPTYWGMLVSKFIAATHEDWDYVIIPDLRFINELNAVCRYNKDVVTVRINRYDENHEPYINPALTEEQAAHISECELDDYAADWFVVNDGSLGDLQDAAIELINNII